MMNTMDRIPAGESQTLSAEQLSRGPALPVASGRWKNRTIISNIRNCFIEVLHHDSDPSTWIVRRWKKFLWFKKRVSSDWFMNRQQAFAYAHKLKGTDSVFHGLDAIKEKQRNAL
jgi:hypothetical protein